MEANKVIIADNELDLPIEGSDDDLSLRDLQITSNSNNGSPRTSSGADDDDDLSLRDLQITSNSNNGSPRTSSGADEEESLRDLQITGNSKNGSPETSSVSAPDIFEFFSSIASGDKTSQSDDIIFCGKLITYNNETMMNTSSSRAFNYDERDRFSRGNRSENLHMRSEGSVHKVNITSLTSMSPTARRRMFMFGPVKFKPEMELSAIRERQSRRAPALMFPGMEEVNLEVEPVKSKIHLTDILVKSLCYRR